MFLAQKAADVMETDVPILPAETRLPTSRLYSGFTERCQLTAYGGCCRSFD